MSRAAWPEEEHPAYGVRGTRRKLMHRNLTRESTVVRLWTTRAADGHRHVVSFREWGAGGTMDDATGHRHLLRQLDVVPTLGHVHSLTCMRYTDG